MKARNAYAVITYNGHNIKTQLKDYATAFEYNDPAEGESDTIAITVADPDSRWIGAWIPTKGDQITAKIFYENKDGDGKTSKIDCGSFLLDDYSYSESTGGRALTISAISAPLDDAFKATERTQNWQGVTLKKIAQTIADRYNMGLIYDGDDIPLSKKQQDKTTDAAFLEDLTKKYGYMLKLYQKKIVIYDREAYKKKETVATISRSQMTNFSWKTTLAGTYTGAEIKYTDNEKNETINFKIGGGKRILQLNEKVDNGEDARRIATAAMNNANHEMTTASFSTMGRPDLVAGQNILISNFAKLSGKYHINKKTDSLSGSGYISNFEVSLISANSDAVAKEAIDRLYYLGVIDKPDYWKSSLKKVKSLSELFINAGASIKTVSNKDSSNASDYINVLADRGVVNTPEYWRKQDYPYLQTLLEKIARAVL